MAAQLRANLGEELFALAYNEFCAPILEELVGELITKGATHITVTTTMFTPGGSHSEVETPEILDHPRLLHPNVELRYTWPFDLKLVTNTLTEQVKRFSRTGSWNGSVGEKGKCCMARGFLLALSPYTMADRIIERSNAVSYNSVRTGLP